MTERFEETRHNVSVARPGQPLPAGKEVQVFFDGECPLCMREIRMLQRLDRKDRITFTDISHPDFSPRQWGLSMAELMARIHGRRADGTWIEGVEVFRGLYAAVGFRRLVQISRWPAIRHILDFMYEHFASQRLRLTGRCHEGLCETVRQS